MSANLLRFRDRVQQLLVRVIFLPGISDSNNPISHATFRWANHVADAKQLFEKHWVKQKMTALSASSAGTWTADLRAKWLRARHHNGISGPHTRTPSLYRCPGRICRPIAFSGRFLTEAIGPEGAIYLVATPYSPVIPPRN